MLIIPIRPGTDIIVTTITTNIITPFSKESTEPISMEDALTTNVSNMIGTPGDEATRTTADGGMEIMGMAIMGMKVTTAITTGINKMQIFIKGKGRLTTDGLSLYYRS